jgi:hypothetical protein
MNQDGPTPVEDPESNDGPVDEKEEKKICVCYCLKRWLAPLKNPDVPTPPNTFTIVGGTETETEAGEMFFNAEVVKKDYICKTKIVVAQSVLNAPLARRPYSQTRSRSKKWGWVRVRIWRFVISLPSRVWGTWSAWTRTEGPDNNDRVALASGNLTPWCPDVGIPCP